MSGAPTEPTPALPSTLMTDQSPTPNPPTETPPPAEPPKEGEAPKEAEALTVESLKVPDGVELDKAAAEGFVAIANELKLPAEGAQKLFEYGNSLLQKASEAGTNAYIAQNEQW